MTDTPLRVIKAHAYGNDFLLIPEAACTGLDAAALARRLCARHTGIGADGVIHFRDRPDGGVTMALWNADGSVSELSGNGLRCLAAWVFHGRQIAPGPDAAVTIDTAAGAKRLELLERRGARFTFRAAMGRPEGIRQETIDVLGERITATLLSVGNPQCIVLGPLPDQARFERVGRALATHARFPEGTNVEFAHVEASDRVRILIWERGVGPTTSSGTGSSAAAVAAAAHGGAARIVDVVAPGGTQRVEWLDDAVYLTGWAELVVDGLWLGEQ